MQYLEAVQAEGTDDADTIVGHLEGKEINDLFLRNGTVRAEDHRVIHDVYLAQVKAPGDVSEDWDYQEILATIPAADAFMPLEESTCGRPASLPSEDSPRPRRGMNEILQYTIQGLAAGSFYALAALGLAIIFGVLGVVNFAHGACYMLGAVIAALLLANVGLNFWLALIVVPVIMFGFGVLIERLLVGRLIRLDPLYNFLATFGLTLLLVDLVKRQYGVSSMGYTRPAILNGQFQITSELRLPICHSFVLVFSLLVCAAVWLLRTRTRVGMIVRASTEKAELSRALGVNVGRWVTPVFGFGIALAGLAGVLAAPFRAINADMGSNFIIILFAVVVIGGLGSIVGAVVAVGPAPPRATRAEQRPRRLLRLQARQHDDQPVLHDREQSPVLRGQVVGDLLLARLRTVHDQDGQRAREVHSDEAGAGRQGAGRTGAQDHDREQVTAHPQLGLDDAAPDHHEQGRRRGDALQDPARLVVQLPLHEHRRHGRATREDRRDAHPVLDVGAVLRGEGLVVERLQHQVQPVLVQRALLVVGREHPARGVDDVDGQGQHLLDLAHQVPQGPALQDDLGQPLVRRGRPLLRLDALLERRAGRLQLGHGPALVLRPPGVVQCQGGLPGEAGQQVHVLPGERAGAWFAA